MTKKEIMVVSFLPWLLLILTVIFPFFPRSSFAAEIGDFTINLSNANPSTNSIITASMSVFVGSKYLAAYDITLKYDPSVLQASKVQGGTTAGFTSITDSQIDNTKGAVKLVHFTTTFAMVMSILLLSPSM